MFYKSYVIVARDARYILTATATTSMLAHTTSIKIL